MLPKKLEDLSHHLRLRMAPIVQVRIAEALFHHLVCRPVKEAANPIAPAVAAAAAAAPAAADNDTLHSAFLVIFATRA